MKKIVLTLFLFLQGLMGADHKSQLTKSQSGALELLPSYEGKLLDRAIRDHFFLVKLNGEAYETRRQLLAGAALQMLAIKISDEPYKIPVSGVNPKDKHQTYMAQVTPRFENGKCLTKYYFLENIEGKDIRCTASGSEIGERLMVSIFDHLVTKKKSQKKA